MTRRLCWYLVLAVAVPQFLAAQHSEQATKAKSGFDKAIMQQVWEAWGTLDPANPAKFYSQEPNHTFYDVAPLRYRSWSEYQAGVKSVFAEWKSMKAKVNYDGVIHSESPTMTWTATTVEMDIVTKDGKNQKVTARWTAIWHRHDNQWLIAHEHVSVPMR